MKTACAAIALALAAFPALAQNVKITPIGSHPGELCANDRAIVFEDPTGVRFLYDPAHNVTGGDDPRLGTIHLVLLTHMHGDHVGDLKLKAPGAGTCANSERVPAPNSTTAEVAAAKNAALVMTRAIGGFVGSKVQGMRGGKPIGFCPQTDGATTVPVATVCSSQTDLGGVFVAKTANASQGVEITIVYASHVNNAPPALLSEAQREAAEGGRRRPRIRPRHRLRRQVHQRADRLPLGRHRHPFRDEDGRERVPQGKPRRAQSRAEPGNLPFRRACDERAGPARIGDPHASERARDGRRKAEAGFAHGSAHQAAQGRPLTSPSAGARWSSTARAVRRRLLREGGGIPGARAITRSPRGRQSCSTREPPCPSSASPCPAVAS